MVPSASSDDPRPAPDARGPEDPSAADSRTLRLLIVEDNPGDARLLDLNLPDAEGLETVHRMIDAAPDLPVIVLTGFDDREMALAAVREGAQDYLLKGEADGELLARSLRYALERRCSERKVARFAEELEEERARLEEVFREAPAFLAVFRGEDHVFEMANPTYRELVGGTGSAQAPGARGRPGARAPGLHDGSQAPGAVEASDLVQRPDRAMYSARQKSGAWIMAEAEGEEALARWTDPEVGSIPPGAFIPLAEETGLIVEFGEQQMRRACTEMLSSGITVSGSGEPIRLNVNLSARQLEDPEVVGQVRSILEETGFPARRLYLEVTESAAMRVPGAVEGLRELGVGLAVDDFGTRYSTLGQVQRLTVDEPKLDHSFIDGLPDDQKDRAIVETVVMLGNALGRRVVRYGTESSVRSS